MEENIGLWIRHKNKAQKEVIQRETERQREKRGKLELEFKDFDQIENRTTKKSVQMHRA